MLVQVLQCNPSLLSLVMTGIAKKDPIFSGAANVRKDDVPLQELPGY